MQKNNLQRYIIWGALAAVAYLMLLQWEKDYGSGAELSEPVQTLKEINYKETEKKEKPQNEILEDIPQIARESIEKANEVFSSTEETSNTVKVLTKTLAMEINLDGGDITELSLLKHAIDIKHPKTPVKLLQNDLERTYIAQSGLIGRDGPDSRKSGRPQYLSEQTEYKLIEKQKEISIPLVYQDSETGAVITKTFKVKKNSYLVEVEYNIKNPSDKPWQGSLFAQIKRDNTIDPLADTSIFAMKPFLGFAYWSEESNYNKIDLHDVKEEQIKLTHKGGWLAFVQHYFLSSWIAPTELSNTYFSRVNSKNENIAGFTSESILVKANETKTLSYSFYAGPKDQNKLREISKGLDLTVDYGWLWMIAQMLFSVLIFIQSYVGNWGWSIVLLTCFVKIIFFPLNQYAFKSMANMRKLQPKMQRLKEMYGEDRQKLSQATMEMYRKEKINPLGSCLPMLIQMPVFIALYWVLSESVEIRHAEFIGWIKDLSIMDPYFVLPGLMAASMFVQQKLSPMVFQDPMQERIMKMMPFMFAVFFLFFPAGLVLYWLVNNILTIAQQWVINKQLESQK